MTSAQAETSTTESTHPWLTGRIIVGIDGSEGSKDALRYAMQLAHFGGARVEAISAWQQPTIYGPVWTDLPWSPAEDARELVQELFSSMFGDAIPESLSAVVSEGSAAKVLIEASEDADLLVVGSRGHGGFTGLLLGSVSAACAEHAKCPVLVVHPSAGRLAHAEASVGLDD